MDADFFSYFISVRGVTIDKCLLVPGTDAACVDNSFEKGSVGASSVLYFTETYSNLTQLAKLISAIRPLI